MRVSQRPTGAIRYAATVLVLANKGIHILRQGRLQCRWTMNTKQRTVIAFGLAVVIEMALCPPWATWCVPIDRKTYQYAWIFGGLNYPECAEKLPWTWQLAADRLMLQWALVILTTAALTFAFRRRTPDEQASDLGETTALTSRVPGRAG